ncbi:MAG TPA: tyrosine--tRNA ligase [Polyangiaceae bacterium]|jgi:tyrosyl-tRNA synthetase|nr:tyrosine--tRNA ligase [Polyangiaceae bacterium]
MTDLFEDLAYRGLIHQETDRDGLRRHTADGSRLVYAGFDPTATSLTIGNLIPLLMLRRFQDAGHRPVVVVGGGTGLIGDPSGKEAERQLRTPAEVQAHVDAQRPIYARVLAFDGPNAAQVANNADWLTKLSFVDALRDIGKHFSVNMMIQKDSVRRRLEEREQGISYTEFSYMLLQAYDFLHLFEAKNVTIQVAGSDQWGNIVAGVDLARRVRQAELFGLTAPLVTKADGTKFGKTEAGAIWLSASHTSAYAFYQFWLGTLDDDIERYLKIFTLFPKEKIDELLAEHAREPGARAAHRALATHVTELLHGVEGRERAEAAAKALFSGDVAGLDAKTLDEVFASAPSTALALSMLSGDGTPFVDLLVQANVAKSKRESRELLSAGSISVNGERVSADDSLRAERLLHGSVALIRRGKKTWHVARFR